MTRKTRDVAPGRRPASLLVLMLACSAAVNAQLGDLRLPISLDADSTNYDGQTSMLLFEGLRLSQGNIGVQADHGMASKLDFEDSVWQFRGNVVIDTGSGRIVCDSADLRFSGHQLRFASIVGTPATFELQREQSEDTTYAEAGRLDYDFDGGVIEFSDNAIISEGGNRISSSYLIYNIAEQRINAQGGSDGDPRVKITYTPRPVAEDAAPPDDNEPENDPRSDSDTEPAPDDDSPGSGNT